MSTHSKSDFKASYIARLKKARIDSGYTQDEIASKLGVTRDTYSKYETRSELPTFLLPLVCKLTNLDPWYFLSGKSAYTSSADEIKRAISTDEQKLLEHYRQSDTNGKKHIQTTALRESMYISASENNEYNRPSIDISALLIDAIDKLKFANPDKKGDYEEAEKQLNRFFSHDKSTTNRVTRNEND